MARRTTARPGKSAATSTSTSTATVANGAGETVTIRMYRQILGDCFLVTHDYEGQRFRALFDCGALQCIGASKPNTKAAVAHIGAVVEALLHNYARA
ncbi:hypothetical protein [Sphingomonas sp. UYP23]